MFRCYFQVGTPPPSFCLFFQQYDWNIYSGETLTDKVDMGDSTEVGPLEILRVSFLLGNGQAPSDIPSDTKSSIRVAH